MAGVSKGGLMHHFPTKDALLRAAAQDTIEKFEQRVSAETNNTPTPGNMTRAYINAVLGDEPSVHHEASPLLLSYLNDKEGVDRPNRFETWQARSEQDGIDPITATIIRFAVDGILYTELIDNKPIPDELRQQISARLHTMLTK